MRLTTKQSRSHNMAIAELIERGLARMPYMAWSDVYIVGVRVIDEEHLELMNLINQIHEGLCASAPEEKIRDIFLRLTACTATHFWHEEKRFEETGYPRAAIHARKHEHLKIILSCFQNGVDRTGRHISFEDQLGFLRDWLMNHVNSEDKQLGVFLNAQGSSESTAHTMT